MLQTGQFIVLLIKLLKKLNKYFVLLASAITFVVYGQTDSLKVNYSYINSIPQNAEVYLNDVLIGMTPVHHVIDSNIADKKITIKLKGYADYIYTTDVNVINETFKLIPLKSSNVPNIVYKNGTVVFPKKLQLAPIIISSVVTATSAVLAYYFKSLAIDKNDEFIATGDPSLLDKKKKYDLIGGISLAVFQLGFGALLYFHFFDN